MDIHKIFEIRKTCRNFRKCHIKDWIIDDIIWAATRSPYASGGPRRTLKTIRNQEIKDQLQIAAHGQKYVSQSDTIIIVSGYDKAKGNVLRSNLPKYVHDCSAAMMSMILMATSYRLGTCWIGHFKPDEVKTILKIKEIPVALLLLGYPQDENFFS